MNEFRTGNLVNCQDDEQGERNLYEIVKLQREDYSKSVDKNYYNTDLVGKVFGTKDKFCGIEAIGVTVTEEHLLNLGFEKRYFHDTHYFCIKIDDINYELSSNFGITINLSQFESFRLTQLDLKIEYIHQVQNIFYTLTQKELNYEQKN